MKYKVKNLIERYVGIISKWDGVECITLNEAALPDVLDPYFALILDVFYSSGIPAPAERAEFYGKEAAIFESTGNKDRFLYGEIPVRIEFKTVQKTENLLAMAAAADAQYPVSDSGTYGFYRLNEGQILFSRSDWLISLRKKLSALDKGFWKAMRAAYQSKMEHFLSDLGAALLQDDDFFYLMSAAGFIKMACLTLFCINNCFEPSNRQYYKKVLALTVLPQSFSAQLETFLRSSAETAEHRYAAAQLIARGIIAL
ncbi:MAG: DUF4037 domain-containing protein [Spirochaetaceae bacterium]|jgi:hypothetical protein|nr:DUF4037 domain-containing protein [Spirochaetaceae bacterium]